jgi:hypothetical protein
MRRLAWICALVVCLLAGCGGDDSSGPFDASLSYLPKESPFAVAIDTDLEGEQWRAVDSVLRRFPLGVDAEEALDSALGEQGLNFSHDVKPVLGNPFVVSAGSVDSFLGSGGDRFVAAIQVDDEDQLDALIERTGARESGEAGDATLYQEGDTVFAVDGDVVVFGESRAALERAVERADGDDHLDQETFEDGLAGLPQSGIAQLYVDVGALLASDPDTRGWRRIEGLSALQTLGMSASVDESGIDVEVSVRTEGKDLSEDDLPIAAGDEAPRVIDNPGEVGFGIRNLAHIVRFAERVAQAVDPEGFGEYGLAKETLNSRLDIDIDEDLIGALTGNVSGSIAPDGGFGIRADLADPAAFRDTLRKAAPALPSLLEGAGSGETRLEEPARGNGLWVLRQAAGQAYYFGVVGDRFVVASDRRRAAGLVREQAVEVEGAEGAVVMGADGQRLLNELLAMLGSDSGFGGLGARLFTGPIGQLAGSLAADSEGLRGRFSLELE